ncbi:hypothetical protein SNOG_01917 [Parastagonospora nodorum SN15]|uniref:Uncharacterized protein n=1 Tax=Phaeosphaeria nodorum (strain SN15 / ATCC MYA-4574 / FGSC 10173) TaxID=321614 RepID=Q0V247_PHANO|nr:hypothetical protein SNOG_01917 [Parastagonospora nodorum SN15]EAT90129.1 hypothetical protein SNOG_01917 [Parastagonospora nodorum SN15]
MCTELDTLSEDKIATKSQEIVCGTRRMYKKKLERNLDISTGDIVEKSEQGHMVLRSYKEYH